MLGFFSILCISKKGEPQGVGSMKGLHMQGKQPFCLLSPQLDLPFPMAGLGDACGARVDAGGTPVPPD